jgi:PAS domain S-box-containing protein
MKKGIAASDSILNADTLLKIIDKLPHIIYLKDSQHRFLLANQACVTMLNTDSGNIVGRTDLDFYTLSYAEQVHKIEKNVLRNGEKKIVPEERFLDPMGRQQVMKTTRIPFYIPELDEIGVLGIAVNMSKEKEMEESIRMKNEVLQKQKEEIEIQKKTAEELYHKVRSGLRVSKYIQDAILPGESAVKRILPDSFILYKTKEVACGDFYWIHSKDGLTYLATIDCTEFDAGGTFISMLCYDLLTEIVKQRFKPSPADILYELNDGLKNELTQSIDLSKMKERVFVTICAIDLEKLYLEHSGSGMPLLLINKYNNQVLEPIPESFGLPFDESKNKYADSRIRIKKGDVFYMMTDGFSLQQTSLRNDKEKFGYGRLKDLLIEISDYPAEKQKELLEELLDGFKGNEEQTDDIILLGVRL